MVNKVSRDALGISARLSEGVIGEERQLRAYRFPPETSESNNTREDDSGPEKHEMLVRKECVRRSKVMDEVEENCRTRKISEAVSRLPST
ncbi:hypothetical protein FA13DRAFT_1725690 [Coprinellus micaceus]|uniref:Uncharacterized protein n=1 Tax=Coprinellus micaceus TaxID=71717 RepID=A0A4Y7TVV2_COPMI|nr:hypothetical protein FA13DRAFT_1725690 [Coprinellus micaceus]